jgi:hypothetical protein
LKTNTAILYLSKIVGGELKKVNPCKSSSKDREGSQPTGFAALETSMSKQYNQLNLEIRFDAAELALLRKLVRQASLAAFEQKHLEEHKELEELLFRLLYDVHYLGEPGEKW